MKFIGGPTGFESYYLEDLEGDTLDHDGDFCICGGTINSWANCTVDTADIHKAIEIYEEKEGWNARTVKKRTLSLE